MNILERAAEFVQGLIDLDRRSAQAWRRCPRCSSQNTIRNGHYSRHPWSLRGRKEVTVQRHLCHDCGRSYSEEASGLVYKSWYARAVHRASVDLWMHGRSSLRRAAEFMRSLIGQQERWLLWHPTKEGDSGEKECFLSASTVFRWKAGAGVVAKASLVGQLEGISCSGEMGTDGLWARLRGGVKRVGLLLIDYQTGLVQPPVVVEGEESAACWGRLFKRASEAGLDLADVNGVTSDGSPGLLSTYGAARDARWRNRSRWL